MTTEPPLFDSSRKALVFALNASKVDMPRPHMNKAMAETRIKKKGKEQEERLGRMNTEPRGPSLRGLDGAAQAGFILQQFARLEEKHQAVLAGLLTVAKDPCSCRAPCCQGWRPVKRYTTAVITSCRIVMSAGNALIADGKSLSVQSALWLLLVEQFFTKEGMTLVEMATRAKVSQTTAAKHRDWVWELLAQTEGEAWEAIDLIFDQTGITGFLG